MPVDVFVVKGADAAQNAYEAMSRVFDEDASQLSILLKVNSGFKGKPATGLCTHPEAVRGLVRFFKEKHVKKLYVGDSSIVGTDTIEALKSVGIWQVCEEEGVECLNLDDSGIQERDIPDPVMVERLKLSRLAFEVDRVVSVPVMKTHMYAGASLSIKNMKGCLYQRDKTRLHRIFKPLPENARGKCLDYGIMDLAKICYADYALVDGTIAMEGFGPSGGTPVEMDLAVASNSPVAADIVSLRLMGMEPGDAPHIDLVRENKGLDESDIRVFPEDYLKWAKRFVRAGEQDLGLHYPQFSTLDRGACSACHAAVLQFFRYHHADFPDKGHITIACGSDLKEEELRAAAAEGEVVLVGNCTARFRDSYPFCKGCPPVPSQIKRTIEGGKTYDD